MASTCRVDFEKLTTDDIQLVNNDRGNLVVQMPADDTPRNDSGSPGENVMNCKLQLRKALE